MTQTEIEARGQLEQLCEDTICTEAELGRFSETVFRQREIVERNVRRLTDKTPGEATRLRSEYDRLLDKGSLSEAEKIMKQLAALHRESVNFARNCLDSGTELKDLQEKFESLRLQALELTTRRRAFAAEVSKVSDAIQRANGKCHSLSTDLRHLERTLRKQQSAAEAVLTE
jgi:chromosome segregation ATPase